MAQIRRGSEKKPAYKRIQELIVARIRSGKLKCGDPVESERALAKLHSVSLMTARQALSALEREGVVERRSGVGTFVAPPKVHFNKLNSFSEQMAERGLTVKSKLISIETIDGEREIAARLRLPPTAPLLKIERLRFGADEPFTIQTTYLPAEEFIDLKKRKRDLERGSLFRTLEQDFDVQIAYADGEVDATAADEQTAELLGLAVGQPVLRIRQISYTVQGRPIAYGFGLYRAERHVLHLRRFR